MSSYASQFEDAVIRSVLPRLEADGFSVFVHPSKDMLPPFLNTFRPGAIACKGDRKIAIEVVSQAQDGPKAKRMREIFAGHPDWELRFLYAPPRHGEEAMGEEAMPAFPKPAIEERLRRIEGAFDAMGTTAALLTAWAAFEAAARRLVPAVGRLQTPAQLLEAMASAGHVTPDEADMLRRVSRIRNEVAHGRLDLEPSREQVEGLLAVTRAVLGLGD